MQAVISAAQVRDEKAPAAYIPIPDASRLIVDYDEFYHRKFKMPANYIRFSNTVEDVIGPAYCMDAADEKWLSGLNAKRDSNAVDISKRPVTELMFERFISELEKLTEEKRREQGGDVLAELTDLDSFLLLESNTSPIKVVAQKLYDYWHKKRSAQDDLKPLMARLKVRL